MDSLPEQHINSLPKEAREGAYRQIGMVCAFRMREFSEDEVARKAKFSSVEDMYFRLKRWGLPGLLPLEEESEKTSKTTPERKARNSGQVIELPPAGNAAPLFREKLEELLHATEDLKHRKESRQGKHYPYRTVSRNSPSDEEWDFFAKLLGLDSVPKDNLYFGGGVINRGTSSPAPESPLLELISTYLLAGGALEPLVEALHDDPSSADLSEIKKHIEGRKSVPGEQDGLKAVASRLAILIRGGTVKRGNPPPGESGQELNLSHRIAVRREAGVSDKQIYEDLLTGLGLSEEQFSRDEFRRLADLGLKLP